MNDLLKKGVYLGLGAAMAGKEKAEKYINDLVKKGELAPSEAKNIIEELNEKGREKQENWSEGFRQEIKGSLHKLGLVTQEEHNELKRKFELLEAKIQELTHQDQ